MSTWEPRPQHPDEPACWSWPIPPPTLTRAERRAQWEADQALLHHDDRVDWATEEALLDSCDPRFFEFHADRCAMCGGQMSLHLVLDHCHDTGQIRGYLCRSCNVQEGWGRRLRAVRYQAWHPAAILDVHQMYTGMGWRDGWSYGAATRQCPRPPTPWPPFDLSMTG